MDHGRSPRASYTRDVQTIERDDLIGGRYLVQEFLGMGIVSLAYLAIDLERAETVAVKVLRSRFLEMPSLSSPAEMYPMDSLLRREIQMHRDLRHPHLVGFRDSGMWDDRLYVVLEYVPDPSLEDLFPDPVEVPLAVSITRQILDVVGYLHEQGVVHRDLKPEHVHYGPERGVTLLDLGLAMHIDAVDIPTIVSIMGSKRYGAPEQYASHDRAVLMTPRSDIYSTAATMERLLYGPTMRLGESPEADDRLPTGLVALLQQAMSPDPENRPPTAEEFDRRLQALTAG